MTSRSIKWKLHLAEFAGRCWLAERDALFNGVIDYAYELGRQRQQMFSADDIRTHLERIIESGWEAARAAMRGGGQ